jgi:hypothetical protein
LLNFNRSNKLDEVVDTMGQVKLAQSGKLTQSSQVSDSLLAEENRVEGETKLHGVPPGLRLAQALHQHLCSNS